MECIVSYIVHPGEFYAQVGDEKKFTDFTKLVSLIQGFCSARETHFHSVSNVEVGEILFLKSVLKDGTYVRAKVLDVHTNGCSAYLMDYGGNEDNVTRVLKIDPTVRRFADIEPQARKFSLAFVKPTGGSWSSGATELFKQNCKGRLTYLPTEDPDHITLIVSCQQTRSVIDLSVLLIQAGFAKRLTSIDNGDSSAPSIAASMSDIVLQQRSVSVQTDNHTTSTSATSPIFVRPPPEFEKISGAEGGEGDGNGKNSEVSSQAVHVADLNIPKSVSLKTNSAYVPPALRGGTKDLSAMYSCLKIASHDASCTCLVCTIRCTLETNTLSHKDRLEWILAVDWPPLSTKEEAVMRCCITGDLLKSEDRELLLNIMLGLSQFTPKSSGKEKKEVGDKSQRRSVESSTQVTSTPNKLVLSSAQLSNDSAPSVDSKPNSADITIVKLSPTLPSQSLQSDFYSLSLTGEEAVESPATKLSVATPYRLPDDHPDNWSDPEDPFLDESSSDSDPDFILESSASAIQANQNAARVDQWTSNSPSTHISSRTVSQEVNRRSSPFEPINSEVTQKPAMGMVGRGRGSPLLRMYNSPTSSPINPMKGFNNTAYPKKSAEGTSQPGRFATGSNVGIKQPNSPKRPVKHGNTQVASYGLGLSATQPAPSGNPITSQGAPTTTASSSSAISSFGMIMYCTFCGNTQHSSANCPDGTKNLFIS